MHILVLLLALAPGLWAAPASAGSEPASPDALTLSMRDALVLAEDFSPDLKVARQREAAAEKNIAINEAYLYPTLDAGGVATAGFPGFNGQMSVAGPGYNNDLGTQGMYSSPYAKTPAGGLVSQFDLLDLKVPYRIKAARYRWQAEKARTEIARYKVDWDALKYYFHCVRERSTHEIWDRLYRTQLDPVYGNVVRLVNRGQHNMADELLIADQREDAAMSSAAHEELYRRTLLTLGTFIGADGSDFECPSVSAMDDSVLAALSTATASAYVLQASLESRGQHALLSSRKAENYPRLTAKASVGALSGTRLTGVTDYSAGLGVSVPIFEGYGIESRIEQAEAQAREKDAAVSALSLFVAVANRVYDERIAFDLSQLGFLHSELRLARDAYNVSLTRYKDYVGPLVDVREAIRDLARVETEIVDDETDLWLARSSKTILNGGGVLRGVQSKG